MNSNKRTYKVKNGILIAVVIAFIIAIIGGTYSRYSSSGIGSGVGEIAKWHIVLGTEDISSETKIFNVPVTDAVANSNVAEGKLAPGKTLVATIKLDPTGSEVAVDYLLDVDLSNITGFSASELEISSLKYTMEGTETEQDVIVDETTGDYLLTESLADVLDGKEVNFKIYITWTQSTELERSLADAQKGATIENILIPVSVTARQHIGEIYTVTFKDGETTLSTATVEEGKTATRPTDPTKAGFDFVNWYSDSELTTEFDFSTDITANTEIYAKWELAQQTWSQDGVNVTDGIITLKVGSAVTGYTGGGLGDGNWYVLGAKDGKLLITTTANVGSTIQLSGQTGYANGISILNTAASSYLNPNLADESRSINVDDINRVTKYDPDSAACYSGNIYAYGNQVKYTLNSIDGKIHYQGATESYLPASDTSSSYESFTYWTGSVWKSLLSGENTTLTSNTYCYYPANLTATYNTECFIKDQNDSEPAFELLFHNGTGSNESYWLGSTYIEARKGKLYLRITKRQCC